MPQSESSQSPTTKVASSGGARISPETSAQTKDSAPLPKSHRTLWTIVAIVSGIGFALDLLPTPEDAIPILGWLDEGVLGTIFLFSLSKLGIEIPILSRFLGRKTNEARSRKR